jgi:hypothetical protein
MKNIDGIYQVDLLGPYGWERFSTAFIEKGKFNSASAEHFTAGVYTAHGKRFEMDGILTQYVDHRPLFGSTSVRGMPIEFSGAIDNGVIDGEARAVEDNKYRHRFRLKRLPFLN